MARARPINTACVLTMVVATAAVSCSGDDGDDGPGAGGDTQAPVLGQGGDEEEAATELGFPAFATRNTTRVGGADPIADAAAVAQAVFPSRGDDTRPRAVALVDSTDWRVAP